MKHNEDQNGLFWAARKSKQRVQMLCGMPTPKNIADSFLVQFIFDTLSSKTEVKLSIGRVVIHGN